MNQKQNTVSQRIADCGAQCAVTAQSLPQVEAEYAELELQVAALNEIAHIHVDRQDNVLKNDTPAKQDVACTEALQLVPLAEAIRNVRWQVQRVNELLTSATSRVEL